MLTAKQLQQACGEMPFIYRAGVWKPRTKPDTFRGAGVEGLEWLAEVKATLSLPIATEVAERSHVEAAIAAGIDYIWIGARTSANPLAVEAIRQSIEQSKGHELKGIFVKNPVNEDTALWIGNIERMEKTGLPVTAIHRGCGHKPCWRMAHELSNTRPNIPILLDPSHMSGDASIVPELMHKIDELGLHGAMIESHCDPANALSDARQQILPADIPALISTHPTQHLDTELQWLRAEIDELDTQLWNTIAARMEVSQRIGEWKKEHHISPLQIERYKQITARIAQIVQQLGLSPDFAQTIWEAIHNESLKKQQ